MTRFVKRGFYNEILNKDLKKTKNTKLGFESHFTYISLNLPSFNWRICSETVARGVL